MRLTLTLGRFTLIDLSVLEHLVDEAEDGGGAIELPNDVHDLSTQHERGFGFMPTGWVIPSMDVDPYTDEAA